MNYYLQLMRKYKAEMNDSNIVVIANINDWQYEGRFEKEIAGKF